MPRTYEPIASSTLGSAASTITFSSIPSTYTDLIVVVHGDTSATANILIRVGNSSADTGTNYSYTYLQGDGSSAASARQSSVSTGIYASFVNTGDDFIGMWQIMSYANTNVFKTVLVAGTSQSGYVFRTVGLWRSTSAIDTVVVRPSSGNLSSGVTASLYGIKAA
jgi:hypothetical protein